MNDKGAVMKKLPLSHGEVFKNFLKVIKGISGFRWIDDIFGIKDIEDFMSLSVSDMESLPLDDIENIRKGQAWIDNHELMSGICDWGFLTCTEFKRFKFWNFGRISDLEDLIQNFRVKYGIMSHQKSVKVIQSLFHGYNSHQKVILMVQWQSVIMIQCFIQKFQSRV